MPLRPAAHELSRMSYAALLTMSCAALLRLSCPADPPAAVVLPRLLHLRTLTVTVCDVETPPRACCPAPAARSCPRLPCLPHHQHVCALDWPVCCPASLAPAVRYGFQWLDMTTVSWHGSSPGPVLGPASSAPIRRQYDHITLE
eukprot:257493-Chlamydomonas_euryale.AAC.2